MRDAVVTLEQLTEPYTSESASEAEHLAELLVQVLLQAMSQALSHVAGQHRTHICCSMLHALLAPHQDSIPQPLSSVVASAITSQRGVLRLVAALSTGIASHDVLYQLVQEGLCGREQANQNAALLAGLQGLLRCSACLEPPLHDSTTTVSAAQVKLAFGEEPRFCPYLIPEQLSFMHEVAVLMIRLQQCDPSNCGPLFLERCLLGPEGSQPMPTQWKHTQRVVRRVSAAMLWAVTETNQNPSVANLKRLLGLNRLLEDILYKSLYIPALNQALDMTEVLRFALMPLLVWSLQGAVPCSGRFYMHRLTQQLLHRASLDPSVFIAEDQDSSLQVTVCVRSMWTLLLLEQPRMDHHMEHKHHLVKALYAVPVDFFHLEWLKQNYDIGEMLWQTIKQLPNSLLWKTAAEGGCFASVLTTACTQIHGNSILGTVQAISDFSLLCRALTPSVLTSSGPTSSGSTSSQPLKWGGGWQIIQQKIVEILLVMRSLTHYGSMQEPLLCSCIGLYEATLFCRPDPDPKPLDQTLMQLLPVFTKSCSQHSISPGYWTTVGLPNIPPQLLQPMMLKHIQDKSLQVDHTLLATLPTHPESLQQQQQVLLSCMQWFHHTLQTAMSNSATTVNSATVSSPDMLPYIRLISQHVRDYEADSAGWLPPQDLVISMLQLLFLATHQLSSQHRYAMSPLSFLESAASLYGLTQAMADEALRCFLPDSLQAAQMGRQEQEINMQLCLLTEALDLVDMLCKNPLWRAAFSNMGCHDWSFGTKYMPEDLQAHLKYLACNHVLTASVRRRIAQIFELCKGGLQATAAHKYSSPNQISPDAHAQSFVEPESKLAEEVRALEVGQQLLAEEKEQLAQAAAKSEKQRSKKQKQKAKKQQQYKQQHEQQQQQEEPEQQQGGKPRASHQDATQSVPHSRPTEQAQLLSAGTKHVVAEGLADLPSSCDRATDRMHRLLCCPITQEIMIDPVIAADGHTYERAALDKWLLVSSSSPRLGSVLPHRTYVPNVALKQIIFSRK